MTCLNWSNSSIAQLNAFAATLESSHRNLPEYHWADCNLTGAPVLFMVERQYQSGFDHSVAVIDRCMGDRQAVARQIR